MAIVSFYDILDTYARINDIDKSEALHQYYRGAITPEAMLRAVLEEEGIFGYSEYLIDVIKTLGFHHQKEGFENPWTHKF